MAQAQRVWLEPEQQQEQVVLRQRRRQQARRPARVPAMLRHPFTMMGLVSIVVALLVVYVSAHACIARNELRRQTYERQLTQLERERVQNNLKIDRLGAQPLLIKLAQQRGLQQPTANRIHNIRVASTFPRTTLAQAPAPAQASWLARSGRQVVAAMHRLSHGPGDPATVQE